MYLTEVAKLAQPPTGPEAAKLQHQINRGKKRSKRLAEASGLLGLGALGLRAPQAANALARRSSKLAATPAVKRLGALAPHATKLSEASVPLSIGTGALGSFNYAHQIGRENKLAPPKKVVAAKAFHRLVQVDDDVKTMAQEAAKKLRPQVAGHHAVRERRRREDQPVTKSDIDGWMPAIVRAQGQYKRTPAETQAWLGEMRARSDAERRAKGWPTLDEASAARAGWIKPKLKPKRRKKAKPKKSKSLVELQKADDRFLRENRDRISPSAERGYEYLRRGRNSARRQSAVSGAIAGGNALGAAYYMKKKNPLMAGAGSLLAVGSGVNAFDRGMQAHRWNKQKMGPIKAKARQRKEAGLYAPGRGKTPIDRTSRAKASVDDLSKALWKLPHPGITPGIRPGGLMRLRTGKTVTRRGSIPGSGRLF